MMSSSPYPHYTDRLLVLPQDDLTRGKHSHRNKGDLVLCQIPLTELLLGGASASASASASARGDRATTSTAVARLMAHETAASLVMSTASYTLTTIGTSNTLVVWETETSKTSKTSNSAATALEEEGQPSPPKRSKPNSPSSLSSEQQQQQQPCRLIQPGGSGASFWHLSERTIGPNDVLPLIRDTTTTCRWTTADLAKKCLVSESQVMDVLDTLPCVELLLGNNNNNNNSSSSSSSSGSSKKYYYWHALSEANVWHAQAAVVAALCEEESSSSFVTNTNTDTATLVQHVQERLDLEEEMEQDNTNVLLVPSSACPAVARKFVRLASSYPSGDHGGCGGGGGNSGVDPTKIVQWVLQEVVRGSTSARNTTTSSNTTPLALDDDLLETVQSRLPLDDRYTQWVTKDWIATHLPPHVALLQPAQDSQQQQQQDSHEEEEVLEEEPADTGAGAVSADCSTTMMLVWK